MLLKNIFLYPDLVEFKDRSEDLLLIRNQTRFIGNYLARHLAKLKFHAEGFNRVCIIGTSNPKDVYLNTSSALSIEIPFNINECLKLEKHNLADYYSNLYRIGLEECNKIYKLPLKELFLWLDEMKKNNYKNEWTFKQKTFKKFELKCKLDCAIDLDKFTLRLIVLKKGKEIFNQIILETPPDEIVYHHKFKDVEIIDDKLTITTRLYGDKNLFQLPLYSL